MTAQPMNQFGGDGAPLVIPGAARIPNALDEAQTKGSRNPRRTAITGGAGGGDSDPGQPPPGGRRAPRRPDAPPNPAVHFSDRAQAVATLRPWREGDH